MAIVLFYLRRRLSAILHFEILEILTIERVLKTICIIVPNFVKIVQTVAEICQFFDFLKMAAIRHLGFVKLILGSSTKSTWGFLSYDKIWLETIGYFL